MAKKNKEKTCCVLTLPLITEPWQEHIIEKRFRILEQLQNDFTAYELGQLRNLERKKDYREVQAQIAKINAELKPLREKLKNKPKKGFEKEKQQLKELEKQYKEQTGKRSASLKKAGFTAWGFESEIIKKGKMQKHFEENIATQIARKTALNVWAAFNKYLYGNGEKIHFLKRGTLRSASNKEIGKSMDYKGGFFYWGGGDSPNARRLKIRVADPETEYEKQMLKKKIKYLRIVRKWVKNRYKYYLQFTLEGNAVLKDRPVGEGRVGIDIGTQSIACASSNEVFLRELADRVTRNHRIEQELQRKMDRSRRASNPQNYNPDGTIRRGIKLKWQYSNRYRRLAGQLRHIQRKSADIRQYQHYCLANHIISLGTEIYVEKMNYKGLQRRAKETTKNEKGRFNKKKRFGKSLANKAPAAFLTILDNKLKGYGYPGIIKVNTKSFRASQYDHVTQKYTKKTLRDRTCTLGNGDVVQRDLYSAFLLMNADNSFEHTNQHLCEETYPAFKLLHNAEIERIKNSPSPKLSSFGVA